MKTTKKQFRDFCKAFKKWQVVFNCNDWDIIFECVSMPSSVYAECDANPENSFATIRLNSGWISGVPLDPHELAKHECIHLFLMRLMYIAGCRYCNEDELVTENERIVRMLERLISDDVDITKLKELR